MTFRSHAWRGCGGESVALRLRRLLPVGVVLGAVFGGSALQSCVKEHFLYFINFISILKSVLFERHRILTCLIVGSTCRRDEARVSLPDEERVVAGGRSRVLDPVVGLEK